MATVGQNTFTVYLVDAAGNTLSRGTVTQTVLANQTNVITVTLDPVVVSMTLPYLAAPSGTSAHIPLSMTALDFDQNPVTGPGNYITADGLPVVVTVTDVDPTGATFLSGNTLSGPTDSVTLNYNGTPHSTAILDATAIGVPNIPNGAFCSCSNEAQAAYAGSGLPVQMITGPDGAIWAAGFGDPGYDVVRIGSTAAQTVYHFQDVTGPDGALLSVEPTGITVGQDGNFWLTLQDTTTGGLVRVTPSGVHTPFTDPSFKSLTGIAAGPDGNLWFSDQLNESIDQSTLSGQITTTSISTGAPAPPGFARNPTFGSDGRLYYVNSPAIGAFTTTNDTYVQYPTGMTLVFSPIEGGDGNLWFLGSNLTNTFIMSMTTSGVIRSTQLPTGIGAGSIAYAADGKVWFADSAFGLRWIGPNGQAGGYPITGLSPFNADTGIKTFMAAPDGSFWVATYNAQGAGEITHVAF
jgi:virginiamycin B lyase